VYEFNLFTNPTILFTVLKVVLGILAVIVILMLAVMLPDLVRGYADSRDLAETLRFAGTFALFFTMLTCVGYAIYAAMQGGKYCVVFTMDEKGLLHKQMARQYRKAQLVGALDVVAGIVAGKPGVAGIGITSARDSLASDFGAVRGIRGSRRLRVIKLNEPLAKNQVYVEPGDYDFVLGYIVSHCPNAKVKG
jgi:cytochrome bd-type quinol oxidase subunit 2